MDLADELAQQLAQLRRFLQRVAEAFEGLLTVDHHRAALEAALEVEVAEADAVCAGVALVLEQLDGRLGVLTDEGRLLDDLTAAPMEVELTRDVTSAPRRSLPRDVASAPRGSLPR